MELVILKGNDAFTDSLLISKGTGNKHHAIQQLISKYESDFQEFGKVAFEMRPLESGQSAKVFLLNEEQATLLLTYMKNTEQIRTFKKNLVSEFYKMRHFILERQTQTWVETRKYGKLTRKAETDTIQKLVEYAKEQGSGHAEMLYMTYSKLANKMAGVKNRDEATVKQLNDLSLMENIILHEIDLGIMKEKHYKEIYKDCKNRLETVKDLAYLEIA